jgi:hypothetical protein
VSRANETQECKKTLNTIDEKKSTLEKNIQKGQNCGGGD